MSTSKDFIEFVCEQIEGSGSIRYRKMFGEYMVYVDDRPVLLVCDNSVFVKKHEELSRLLADSPTGVPYEGAKEHYMLDIENTALARETIAVLLPLTAVPVKKSRLKKS